MNVKKESVAWVVKMRRLLNRTLPRHYIKVELYFYNGKLIAVKAETEVCVRSGGNFFSVETSDVYMPSAFSTETYEPKVGHVFG